MIDVKKLLWNKKKQLCKTKAILWNTKKLFWNTKLKWDAKKISCNIKSYFGIHRRFMEYNEANLQYQEVFM